MSQAELNLDHLLAGMAEDVPPMPAAFHEQWMNAVREEAKQAEPPAPAPVSQWPRILSVAAVFVFLIGGTLIYRSARKPIQPANESVSTMAVTEGAVNEEAAMEEAAAGNAAMVEDAMEAVYEAAASAGETDAAAPAPAAGSFSRKEMGAKSAEVSYAAEAMTEEENAAEDTSMSDYAMEEAKEAEEEAVAAVPVTEVPATEALATEIPATEVPAAAPDRSGISGFFADMGDFLLEVWPYVLIAVVPLAVAAGVKRFRKK